jgi:hypothetical protein
VKRAQALTITKDVMVALSTSIGGGIAGKDEGDREGSPFPSVHMAAASVRRAAGFGEDETATKRARRSTADAADPALPGPRPIVLVREPMKGRATS